MVIIHLIWNPIFWHWWILVGNIHKVYFRPIPPSCSLFNGSSELFAVFQVGSKKVKTFTQGMPKDLGIWMAFFLESHHGFVPAHLLAIWRQWAKRAFFPKEKKKYRTSVSVWTEKKKTNIHQGLGFITRKSLSPDSSEVFFYFGHQVKKGIKINLWTSKCTTKNNSADWDSDLLIFDQLGKTSESSGEIPFW